MTSPPGGEGGLQRGVYTQCNKQQAGRGFKGAGVGRDGHPLARTFPPRHYVKKYNIEKSMN